MESEEALTKTEAEERLRFEPDDALFCPDCLTRLVFYATNVIYGTWYCPNEMCLNDA